MPSRSTFSARSLEDAFAVFLARELSDTERIRFYATLCRKHSLCLLINSLRRARNVADGETVTPERFLEAVREISSGEAAL